MKVIVEVAVEVPKEGHEVAAKGRANELQDQDPVPLDRKESPAATKADNGQQVHIDEKHL